MIQDYTEGAGIDVIYEATGSQDMLVEACRFLNKGGAIVQLGVTWGKTAPILPDKLVLNEAAIHGCVSGMGTFEEALALLSSRRLGFEKFLEHQYPLEQYEEAFHVDRTRRDGAIKVILRPHPNDSKVVSMFTETLETGKRIELERRACVLPAERGDRDVR